MPWTDIKNGEDFKSVRDKINALGQSAGGGGWINYTNTGAPFVVNANEWTNVPNDGLGVGTNKTFAPRNITDLLDVTTGDLDVSELNLGDIIQVRSEFKFNPQINGAYVEFRYTGNNFSLARAIGTLNNGSSIDYDLTFLDLIYMGTQDTIDNPINMEIRSSEAGTVTWNDTVIQVIRY